MITIDEHYDVIDQYGERIDELIQENARLREALEQQKAQLLLVANLSDETDGAMYSTIGYSIDIIDEALKKC